jgi:XTP/dITP diphosphohydrolase
MKLFFITSNEGKFNEAVRILLDVEGVELNRLEIDYPEIQADSLQAVTEFAVEWLKQHSDLWNGADYVMIEDSGLFIERFKGFPGVYSAYVHETLGHDSIMELMGGEWDRRAHFETCIGLVSKEGVSHFFSGRCNGTISKEPKGQQGFGYDPIFIPEGETNTFAEMSIEEKNQYSHRSRAFAELKTYLALLKIE